MNYIRAVEIDTQALAGTYLVSLPVIRKFTRLELNTPVTFLVGENGSGKSTLIEAIAVAAGFNPEGGSMNFNFHTRDSHSPLWENTTLVKNPVGKWKDGFFLRAESYYNVATNIEEMDRIPSPSPLISASYGGQSLHEMSHGESFMALLRNRLGGEGLYIFDEPEAALSPARILEMMSVIKALADKGSQFIISTHSPILTAYPDAEIYEITEEGLEKKEWRMTENVLLTKGFLSNPNAFFEKWFDERKN